MIKNSIPPEEMEKLINETLFEMFKETHQSIIDLVGKKFHDYGGMPLLEFRDLGIFIRTTSKYFRLRNLYKKDFTPKVDESVVDTWRDIAAYAIWAITLRNYTAMENAIRENTNNSTEGDKNEHQRRTGCRKRVGVQTGPDLRETEGAHGKVPPHRKSKRSASDRGSTR